MPCYSFFGTELSSGMKAPLKEWKRTQGVYSLAICIAYAVTDEWHQTWTSHRVGSPLDVTLDSAGAAAAMLWIRWRSVIRKDE